MSREAGPWIWHGSETAVRYGTDLVEVARVDATLSGSWNGWVFGGDFLFDDDKSSVMVSVEHRMRDAGFHPLSLAEWLEQLRRGLREVRVPEATAPTEITPERIVNALRASPSLLLQVRSALRDLRVVGPWVSVDDGTFKRFERNHFRDPPDGASRLAKWGNRMAWVFPPEPVMDFSSPPPPREWSWITSLSPHNPYYDEADHHPADEYVRAYSRTREDAMQAADDMLRTDPRLILMGYEDDEG